MNRKSYSDLFPSVEDIMKGKETRTVDPYIWLVIRGKPWEGMTGAVISRYPRGVEFDLPHSN